MPQWTVHIVWPISFWHPIHQILKVLHCFADLKSGKNSSRQRYLSGILDIKFSEFHTESFPRFKIRKILLMPEISFRHPTHQILRFYTESFPDSKSGKFSSWQRSFRHPTQKVSQIQNLHRKFPRFKITRIFLMTEISFRHSTHQILKVLHRKFPTFKIKKFPQLPGSLLRADPGYGPCQQKVLAEYINNNNNEPLTYQVHIHIHPRSYPR